VAEVVGDAACERRRVLVRAGAQDRADALVRAGGLAVSQKDLSLAANPRRFRSGRREA
jgi:hypothetical protein